ncbi:hypothetical protein [Pseudophaeobacter profundi]|uniref:hypothetical protein n=1 Tax=Pseudophaeobacter profundi TaxID=3034152 RepID=UPI0024303A95|nr:hypothetical protein [Pseudophaeobacter profundi]
MSTRHTARAADTKIAHIRPVRNNAIDGQIKRVLRARQQIAQQINNGEEWMLPLLKRFNSEIEALEEKQDLIFQAAQIANHAAPNRAA